MSNCEKNTNFLDDSITCGFQVRTELYMNNTNRKFGYFRPNSNTLAVSILNCGIFKKRDQHFACSNICDYVIIALTELHDKIY